MTLLLLPIVAAALAAFALGYRLGLRRGEARRVERNRPPAPKQSVMVAREAIVGPCPGCGNEVKRHPAVTEKRCVVCIAAAADEEDEAFVERMKAEGW